MKHKLLLFIISILFISCNKDVDITDETSAIYTELPDNLFIAVDEKIDIKGSNIALSDSISFVPLSKHLQKVTVKVQEISNDIITLPALTGLLKEQDYQVNIIRGTNTYSQKVIRIVYDFKSLLPDKEGMTIKGYVYCDGKGIPDVVISDGVITATTDENGVYYLPSNKKFGYVFISTPSNYEVPRIDGVMKFYKFLGRKDSVADVANFELKSVNNDKHAVLYFADLHMTHRWGFPESVFYDENAGGYLKKGILPDLNATSAYYQSQNIPVYAFGLGDLTWNQKFDGTSFREIVSMFSGFKGSLFYVIGNHELYGEKEGSDLSLLADFQQRVGPAYYSLNIGKIHYVVINNAEVKFVDETQIAWLKSDLQKITDKSTPIVVALHRPFGSFQKDYYLSLKAVLADFKNIKVFTGHYHTSLYQEDTTNNLKMYSIPMLSGTAWWTARYAKNLVSPDGAPGVYAVWEMDGKEQKYYYKGVGLSKEYRFRTYDLNNVLLTENIPFNLVRALKKDSIELSDKSIKELVQGLIGEWYYENKKNQVLVYVWGYNKQMKISVKDINTGVDLKVDRVTKSDPLHMLSNRIYRLYNNTGKGFDTVPSDNFFRVTASSATSTLEITVVDEFGKTYKQTMKRPKAFNSQMDYNDPINLNAR